MVANWSRATRRGALTEGQSREGADRSDVGFGWACVLARSYRVQRASARAERGATALQRVDLCLHTIVLCRTRDDRPHMRLHRPPPSRRTQHREGSLLRRAPCKTQPDVRRPYASRWVVGGCRALLRGSGWVPVFLDVSLQVVPGEIVAVIGRRLEGKTTLLKIAAGMERPDSGAVLFGERPLAELVDRPAQFGGLTATGQDWRSKSRSSSGGRWLRADAGDERQIRRDASCLYGDERVVVVGGGV